MQRVTPLLDEISIDPALRNQPLDTEWILACDDDIAREVRGGEMLGDWHRIDSRREIVIEEDPGRSYPTNQLHGIRGIVAQVRVRHPVTAKVEIAAS